MDDKTLRGLYELACLDAQRDGVLLTPERRKMAFLTLAPAAVSLAEWKAALGEPQQAQQPQRENELESAYANAALVAFTAIQANGGKISVEHHPKKSVAWKTA